MKSQHMTLETTGKQREEPKIQEKIFQVALFRLVYQGAPAEPWFDLLPVLFTAFTLQLQWLTTTAASCGGSTMITA
jgi:hypothetical protein